MKRQHLSALACLVAVWACSAHAQEPARLLFEVSIGGSVLARPELRVPSGGRGQLELNDDPDALRRFKGLAETIAFVPTINGDEVTIAFDITSGDERMRPRLVISRTAPGSLQWTSGTGAHHVKLTVSWIR